MTKILISIALGSSLMASPQVAATDGVSRSNTESGPKAKPKGSSTQKITTIKKSASGGDFISKLVELPKNEIDKLPETAGDTDVSVYAFARHTTSSIVRSMRSIVEIGWFSKEEQKKLTSTKDGLEWLINLRNAIEALRYDLKESFERLSEEKSRMNPYRADAINKKMDLLDQTYRILGERLALTKMFIGSVEYKREHDIKI